MLALKEWNIPWQAVTLLASGPAANCLVALSSGALDATLLAPPETGEAARMGAHGNFEPKPANAMPLSRYEK